MKRALLLLLFLIFVLSGCAKSESFSIDNVNGIVVGLESPFKVEVEIIKTAEKLSSVLNMVNEAKKTRSEIKNINYNLKMLIYLSNGDIVTVYWDSNTDNLFMENKKIIYRLESANLNKYFNDLYDLGIQKLKIAFPEIIYSNRFIGIASIDRMTIKDIPEIAKRFAESYAISDLNPNFNKRFMNELISRVDERDRELLKKALQSVDENFKNIPHIPSRIERVRYKGEKAWLISINWVEYTPPEDVAFSSNSYLRKIAHFLVSDDGKILYRSYLQ